jgi:O-antigen/teichoic acid export membrane protein
MQGKMIKDLSASSAQVLLNHALNLAIFYLTSRYLSKEIFGELSWSLATSTILIALLSFGLDLVVVKKIASGNNKKETAGLHLLHVLTTAAITGLLLLILHLFFPLKGSLLVFLPGILISQLISSLASPFKQIANGTRSFTTLAIISVTSNIVKVILLAAFLAFDTLTSQYLIGLYIIASVIELLIAIVITISTQRKILLPVYFNWSRYKSLIREALPQYGVTIFNIVLARFDWIILGILTSAAVTAEYSFAYRVFELCRLPLLILSPLLIPIFSRLFAHQDALTTKKQVQLGLLFRTEMVLSLILPVIMVSCWTPLMEFITNNKYGAGNEFIFILLAVCVPIQFATDFYWNICFAKGQLLVTFRIAVISGLLNIVLNLFLIPFTGALGAAIAYVACFILQLILFWRHSRLNNVQPDILHFMKAVFSAFAALVIAKLLTSNPWITVLLSISLYFLLCMFSKLISFHKIRPALILLLKQKRNYA